MSEQGHRVVWFGPDRPVGGGTVFVRAEPCHTGPAALQCAYCAGLLDATGPIEVVDDAGETA